MYQLSIRSEESSNTNICDVYLYSRIEHSDYSGFSASKLISQLQSTQDISQVNLHINSEGGDMFESITLYNTLKNLSENVEVIANIEGLCASGASIIAMAASKIIMHSGSCFMIHNPMSGIYGDSEDMQKASELLKQFANNLAEIYSARTGLETSTILDLMQRETWLDTKMSKELGFCDEIKDANQDRQQARNLENKALEAINLAPVKIADSLEAAINLMAGFINGKRNNTRQ